MFYHYFLYNTMEFFICACYYGPMRRIYMDNASFLPDKFEPGTLNLPGIAGLHAALADLHVQVRSEKYERLTTVFLDGLRPLQNIRLAGLENSEGRLAVFGIDFIGCDNATVANILDERYGIMTRVGMHCAPSAHRTLGSFPQGLVRFSFGPYTTEEEIEYTLAALREIIDKEK